MAGATPLSLSLAGRLSEVLSKGQLTSTDTSRGTRRYQVIRYFCGSQVYARVVRIQLVVNSEVRYTITPKGPMDEIYLDGTVPEGASVDVRLVRDPDTDPSVFPVPFPEADVRVEVFG